MPAGKKIAIAVATLMAGLSLALVFRKSDAGAETAVGGQALEVRLTRRLPLVADDPPPTPYRLAPQPDTSYQPPLAATGSGVAEVFRAPNGFGGDPSPIGALLQPLKNEATPSGAASLAPGPELPPQGEAADAEPVVRRHRIADGDTLSKLAAEYLGSSERYLEIFECNRDVLKSPDLLPVGKTLKLPPRVGPTPAAPLPAISPSSPPAGSPSPSSAAPATIVPWDGWRPAK